MRISVAILTVACLTSGAVHVQRDPVADELSTSKVAYEAEIRKAQTAFLAATDAYIEEVRKSSLAADQKVVAIRQLQEDREAFVSGEKLPAAAGLKAAVLEYQRTRDAARDRLGTAYQRAIDTYVRGREDGKAAALLKERNAFVIGEGHELVGNWEMEDTDKRIKEVWAIKKEKGQWSITTEGRRGTKVVNSFFGKDMQYANGVLSFKQIWTKKSELAGNAEMELRVEKDQLHYTWRVGDQKGDGRMDRAKK